MVDQRAVYRLNAKRVDRMQASPTNDQEMRQLMADCANERLVPVMVDIGDLGWRRAQGSQAGHGRDAAPVAPCLLANLAPGFARVRWRGCELDRVDFGSLVAEQRKQQMIVAISDDVMRLFHPLISTTSPTFTWPWPDVPALGRDLASIEDDDPSPQGAAEVPLDGCLSVVGEWSRVVVGISATTTPEMIRAGLVFDCAATIYAAGGDGDYCVIGWSPYLKAVALDLATLGQEPVTVLSPIAALVQAGLLDVPGWQESPLRIEPKGSARLLKRLFRDWQALRDRVGNQGA
ncbi:MAG: hypothetical protein MP439_10690 [Ferrimicrobium sp.]|nr:hypothetical protein [Ferrimicrobium sp.]